MLTKLQRKVGLFTDALHRPSSVGGVVVCASVQTDLGHNFVHSLQYYTQKLEAYKKNGSI